MSIQTLTSVAYEIISHSWAFASIIVKYYLLITLAYLYSQGKFNTEDISDRILKDSRIVVSICIAIGTLLYLASIKPSPLLTIFSELVALVYLGYLFWTY